MLVAVEFIMQTQRALLRGEACIHIIFCMGDAVVYDLVNLPKTVSFRGQSVTYVTTYVEDNDAKTCVNRLRLIVAMTVAMRRTSKQRPHQLRFVVCCSRRQRQSYAISVRTDNSMQAVSPYISKITVQQCYVRKPRLRKFTNVPPCYKWASMVMPSDAARHGLGGLSSQTKN